MVLQSTCHPQNFHPKNFIGKNWLASIGEQDKCEHQRLTLVNDDCKFQ